MKKRRVGIRFETGKQELDHFKYWPLEPKNFKVGDVVRTGYCADCANTDRVITSIIADKDCGSGYRVSTKPLLENICTHCAGCVISDIDAAWFTLKIDIEDANAYVVANVLEHGYQTSFELR